MLAGAVTEPAGGMVNLPAAPFADAVGGADGPATAGAVAAMDDIGPPATDDDHTALDDFLGGDAPAVLRHDEDVDDDVSEGDGGNDTAGREKGGTALGGEK